MDPIIFGGVILAFVVAVGLVAAATRGQHAPGHLRVVGAVFLFAVAAFCIFGFLASFELPGVPAIGIGYAACGIASLVGAARLLTPGTASTARS
jgi:hypothetical protein